MSKTSVKESTTTQATNTQEYLPRKYSLFNIWVVTLFLKMLLMVGYHSTDFDVHRNWLAITNKLPLSEWYIENTSQWTLDYPPFFAYFEWLMSQVIPRIVRDDGCLDIVEKGIYGMPTIYFQRFTVIVSEVVLFLSLQWYIDTSGTRSGAKRAYVAASSLVLSPGLLLIDHIHFQYNGMMYGFLVLAINCARLEKYLLCGFWFSVLLCFKHIYLYLAPAVFVFLLRVYCLDLKFDRKKNFIVNVLGWVKWKSLFKLGSIVIGVFSLAFGPFVYHDVIPQLVARLFPFSRGLTHAYWAPNMWAIYSFIDRVLIQVYQRVPFCQYPLQKIFHFDPILLSDSKLINTATRGIVGDIEFLVLPTITPQLTFFLTLFYQIMALIPLFLQPNFKRFIGALTLCGYASFLFGWHVHEKAILIVIFPITFLVSRDKRLLGPFNLLVTCGYVSLMPLIFTCSEWLVKVVYLLLWYIIYYFNFRKVVKLPKNSVGQGGIILDRVINGYILGLVPVLTVVSMIDLFEHKFEVLKRLEFLKLMIISVYCGVGIISSWNGFCWLYFVDEVIWDDEL
jgi:alpha-1,3-glucosyltransferase